MKRILLLCSTVFALLLAGCFETTDELTLNEDGSGVVTSVNDMSMLLSMMKGMGGAEALGAEKPTDTTITLIRLADSISTLTSDERELVRKGKLGLVMNLNDEKMITRLEVPFTKVEQVDKIKSLSSKITTFFLSQKSGGMPPGMGDKMPSSDPFGDYYTVTYGNGVIEKKLNKEKYSKVDGDEMMKGLKEVSDNGMPVSNTVIINLPKPAKSATGKNVVLSEDKKKVTIKGTSEDFFENSTALEFKIEY